MIFNINTLISWALAAANTTLEPFQRPASLMNAVSFSLCATTVGGYETTFFTTIWIFIYFSQLNLFLQLHLKTVPAIKVRDINLINKTWIACIHPKSYFRMQSSFLTQLLSVQSRLLLNKHFKLIRHQLCGKMDTHLVCSNCLIPPPPLVSPVFWLSGSCDCLPLAVAPI